MIAEDGNLNNRQVYGNLARVAVPIALQSLIGSSLNLVDNLMVGSLGEDQLAAVGVSVQIFFIFWMIIYGFSSGCSTFMAQFWGAGDLAGIRKTIGFTLTVALAIGLGFYLVATIAPGFVLGIFTDIPATIKAGIPYIVTGAPCFLMIALSVPFEIALRATQQTKIPLFVSVMVFSMNTFLNYVFIFGNLGAPEMGIKGAALATTFSRATQVIAIGYMVFVRKNIIAGPIKSYFAWNKKLAKNIIKNAVPTTINETMWGLGFALYVAIFARVGITQFAAYQAANTIQNLLQLAAFSVGDGILILVGQKLGEGKIKLAYQLAKKLMVVGTVVGVVFGVILIIIAKPVISLFKFSPEGASYSFWILVVFGSTLGLILYNGIMIVGVLRCGGDTRFAMFTEVGTVWLIGVPIAFVTALVFHWPIYWVILAVKIEELVKCVILTRRFLSKKWAKQVIEKH